MATRPRTVPGPHRAPRRLGSRSVLPRAVAPQPVPPDADLDHPSLYFNRELSWLDFNWRVIALAYDERTPLLERARFLAIAQNNLDEFCRKRVGGLKRQRSAQVRQLSPDGRTPSEQLDLIHEALLRMQQMMTRTWDELRPRLRREAGIEIFDYTDLDEGQRERLRAFFTTTIYPILTPLSVDPGHPFPFISNLSLSLAVLLRHPTTRARRFARVKIPLQQGRWVALERPTALLPMEQLVREHVGDLFRGMVVEGAHLFRVTRNADVPRDEEEVEDLLEMISAELRERRFAPVVRLEVESSMSGEVRELLCRELDLEPTDVYEVEGLLDLAGLAELVRIPVSGHRYEPWEPITQPRLMPTEATPDIFGAIRSGDVLVHHPYDSFSTSVLRLLEEAAADPRVLAIKQTLYRTSEDSPVVQALIRAAEHGKQVAALVEVTARFDEESNIEWAQELERAGVHVTYGVVGLKTHAKVLLIVRHEDDGIRMYCHLGTGNYHPGTARAYTDLGLLTCDPGIAGDVVDLFHFLTGYAPEQQYEQLVIAPAYMRAHFEALIDREIAHQREHGDGAITAKLNAIDDVQIIRRLYQASQAGVKIDLIVRGHTRLRPGLPRFSENIRIISILGRFLEHDRIFLFHNHGDPDYYVGSADWRWRNLEERVEAVFAVRDPAARQRLRRILEWAWEDNRQAWELRPDGRYVLRRPRPGDPELGLQARLMADAQERQGPLRPR